MLGPCPSLAPALSGTPCLGCPVPNASIRVFRVFSAKNLFNQETPYKEDKGTNKKWSWSDGNRWLGALLLHLLSHPQAHSCPKVLWPSPGSGQFSGSNTLSQPSATLSLF